MVICYLMIIINGFVFIVDLAILMISVVNYLHSCWNYFFWQVRENLASCTKIINKFTIIHDKLLVLKYNNFNSIIIDDCYLLHVFHVSTAFFFLIFIKSDQLSAAFPWCFLHWLLMHRLLERIYEHPLVISWEHQS